MGGKRWQEVARGDIRNRTIAKRLLITATFGCIHTCEHGTPIVSGARQLLGALLLVFIHLAHGGDGVPKVRHGGTGRAGRAGIDDPVDGDAFGQAKRLGTAHFVLRDAEDPIHLGHFGFDFLAGHIRVAHFIGLNRGLGGSAGRIATEENNCEE